MVHLPAACILSPVCAGNSTWCHYLHSEGPLADLPLHQEVHIDLGCASLGTERQSALLVLHSQTM